MACKESSDTQEPSVEADKLSYEIFSILESQFLFGYDEKKIWIPKHVSPVLEASTVPESKFRRGKICILSIDGGNMRGILPGKVLSHLEHALKSKSGNPDARISDFFDLAAGTGVGGIFSLMLFGTKNQNRSILKADETWRFLADNGKKIYSATTGKREEHGLFRRFFKGSSSAPATATSNMEKMMKEIFSDRGRSLTLRDTLKPVLVPCFDASSGTPFVFSRADAHELESFDFNLWEVCRATAAEPAVFEPVVARSVDARTAILAVDGRMAMSNPTAAAITHVLHNKQEFPFVRGVEDLLVLSLGTGQVTEICHDYDQVRSWKAKHWSRPLAQVMADSSATTVDQAVAMAFGQSDSSNYLRIQANRAVLGRCGPNVDTDPSPNNVNTLIGIAEEMMKQKNVESVLFEGKKIGEQSNMERLDWFAAELVQEHQRRSCRIAPTVALKQGTFDPKH